MAIAWNPSFETGIAVIDEQHRTLVELINEAAPTLSSNSPLPGEQNAGLLDRLQAYAATHFRTEEALMREFALDNRHTAQHFAEHAHFERHISQLLQDLHPPLDNVLGPKLLAYLIHWLTYHILDVDQHMAQQIALIRSGESPEIAYEHSLLTSRADVSRETLVAALVDIQEVMSERRRAAAELQTLTEIDPMTGLCNRSHFVQALNRAVVEALALGHPLALLLIDVDDLAGINQSAGHEAADKVLVTLAERLRQMSRRQDLSARSGTDEFVIALLGGEHASDLVEAAGRLYAALAAPVVPAADGVDHPVFGISGGVALFPDDAADGDHLLAAAEMAQIAARQAGGGQCLRFQRGMGRPATVRSQVVTALRYAIENNQLILHYQPQVSLHSGEIVGFEALVRWQHPEKGLVPPAQFIPLAEDTGLIVPLGEWVIDAAMRQMRDWFAQGLPEVRVAVNMSARHFREQGLASLVESQLKAYTVSPHLFELELTESVMMHDPATAIKIVERIKGIGVQLSLDDFGTGYSSLSYLSRFAIDMLKIDQSFVRDITSNPVNASIATATIAMAHKLGMSVIAEGVETDGQMHYLRRHDCDEMQGYLFSRPVPAENAADLLRKGSAQSFGEINPASLPCLLLLDDEANIINALKRLLRREGYRILTAETGPQALELLASNDIQVIVSDQRMPDMTGSEFLARVKDMYPNTVRMVLSGYSELSAVTEAINRGAIYKFLAKPWKDEELKTEIRQAFRHHRESFRREADRQ